MLFSWDNACLGLNSCGERICVWYVFLIWLRVKMWKVYNLCKYFMVFCYRFVGSATYLGWDNHAFSRSIQRIRKE